MLHFDIDSIGTESIVAEIKSMDPNAKINDSDFMDNLIEIKADLVGFVSRYDDKHEFIVYKKGEFPKAVHIDMSYIETIYSIGK